MDAYSLFRPLIRPLQPETAHHLALKALEYRLISGVPYDDPVLETTLWGLRFRNPVGLAAGFDKDADVPMQALALGFGFVEIGSVTPRPQPGNPKPRLFRLDEDEGVINRMGFNSKGAENAAGNLEQLPTSRQLGVIGVNLGKNKETADAAADYVIGIEMLARFADYIVVNVSSPNTPGLRALQDPAELEGLIGRVREALDRTIPENRPPLLVKVAPDLTDADIAYIAAVAMSDAVDGLIATNTTITRPDTLKNPARAETGGLSGKPLKDLSTRVIADFYTATKGTVPIVGVGGVASGADAYAKIRAGASLVQVYSGMVFEGPSLPGRICRSLAGLLKRDGFKHVADAVGADH
ncbi:MAG: quinone-dependent dihydroorotate dehydrogenase [Rhodospirillales bacterium]|nr:quinone-dependent dihydroorotate dehydrogenase [Rhodospirillales bacterium]MBO6787333.1 quinone-dependent dihydroorotate dehydrogenase [Rhodospirillales bacterium]